MLLPVARLGGRLYKRDSLFVGRTLYLGRSYSLFMASDLGHAAVMLFCRSALSFHTHLTLKGWAGHHDDRSFSSSLNDMMLTTTRAALFYTTSSFDHIRVLLLT